MPYSILHTTSTICELKYGRKSGFGMALNKNTTICEGSIKGEALRLQRTNSSKTFLKKASLILDPTCVSEAELEFQQKLQAKTTKT